MICYVHTYIYAVCERDGLVESSYKIVPLNSNHNMTVVGVGSMVSNAIVITHRS